MIIWLASYPKSGNTWTRILIGQMIYYHDNDINFYQKSKKIYNYPEPRHFRELVKDSSNRSAIVENWINSQNILCLKNDTQIFKTHNMLGSFGKHHFTNHKITKGVIHVVRDPRDVISSVQNHFSLENQENAKKFILDKNKWLFDKGRVDTFISSWNYHYLSWKSFKKNYLLIKYEDLIEKPKNEILRLYNYLKQFFEISIKENELDKIIENSSFENLQKLEKEGTFKENTFNRNTGEKNIFFRIGKSKQWGRTLDKKIISDLELSFKKEMEELGYL